MKRIISVIIAVIFIFSVFSGCSEREGIELVSGEIVEKEGGYIVSFTVSNNTGKSVENLSAVIVTYSDKTEASEEKEVTYPLPVANGENATLSIDTEKKCVSAKITSCSYKTESGKTKQCEFEEEFTAYIKKSSSSTVKTREQLAEEMIRDIKTQFLKKGSLSTGSYDPEKKQLVIVSKYEYSYDVCVSLYEKDPDSWKSLSDGIVSMSQTCYDEFKEYNFDDVNVSVGVISSDEELMFSATNGTLMESLDSQ